MINNETGKMSNETTCDELIEYLKGHRDAYGNTPVKFYFDGQPVNLQFEHYKNELSIDIEEED